jgi:hypothetical protein
MTRFIDLTGFSFDDLKVLEQQIAQKKQELAIAKYKISFCVAFDPTRHRDDDLTIDGEVDPGAFFDYIYDNVLPMIRKDFGLAAPEDVFYPTVEVL